MYSEKSWHGIPFTFTNFLVVQTRSVLPMHEMLGKTA